MPSELQRVARGLVDCFDEIPRVVEHLQRTAVRCRENAQLALSASQGQATVAAQQLDAAARACEAAAHYLSMAPPKSRAWAEGLVGAVGPSTNRPSSDSANRNKATGGTGDAPERDSQGRTKRLTAGYEDLDLEQDGEPPVITVARKAFENYRKTHKKDEEQDDDRPEDLLEFEITITESEEIKYEERNKKEEAERETRLTADHPFDPDPALTEAIKSLLTSMSQPPTPNWTHATLTITPTHLQATFDYPEDTPPAPITADIQLPDTLRPTQDDFNPAVDLRPIGSDFAPGVHDPAGRFVPKERDIADRLEAEGWRIDARPENHTVQNQKNPDATLRRSGSDDGVVVEFKTLDRASLSAVKRNINNASDQVGAAGEVFIDGRKVDLDEAMAWRGFRMACGQPGKSVDAIVHVILGDGRMVTFRKGQ
ncbi:hypothetical protein GCM10009804_10360 [Kribbella hippodromi]|uniref:tRNA nuclease CdiA C-terminal domain-containing protein n=1 Tax=Kribbella hippodromi TaxID=434347 RepID=A0ABN2CDA7_9ACTN